MPRAKYSKRRSATTRQAAAIQLFILGVALAVFPLVMGQSKLAGALKPVSLLGWLFMVIGGGLWWLVREAKESGVHIAPARSAVQSSAKVSFASDNPVPGPLVRDAMRIGREAAVGQHGAERVRPSRWGRDVFAILEWRRFEAVVEALFEQCGFSTRSQSHGADGGVDIWLYPKDDSTRPIGVVQCKHWSTAVGVDKIRELRGVMASRNLPRGHLATTSRFTTDAKVFARENNIHLLDCNELLLRIAKRPTEDQDALLAIALEGEYWRPTCARCGVKMREVHNKKDGSSFWGCASFPQCRNTLNMRSAL